MRYIYEIHLLNVYMFEIVKSDQQILIAALHLLEQTKHLQLLLLDTIVLQYCDEAQVVTVDDVLLDAFIYTNDIHIQ